MDDAQKREIQAAVFRKMYIAIANDEPDERIVRILEDELKARGLWKELTPEQQVEFRQNFTARVRIAKEEIKNFKAELERNIAEELKKDGVTESSLTKVIQHTIAKTRPPSSNEEAESLEAESRKMATELLKLKKERGADGAMIEYTKRANRLLPDPLPEPKSDPAPSFPVGTTVGAAAGLGAAAMIDVGDWHSLSGILKKMAIITAGLLGGMFIADDFGVRSAIFSGPAKQQDKGGRA